MADTGRPSITINFSDSDYEDSDSNSVAFMNDEAESESDTADEFHIKEEQLPSRDVSTSGTSSLRMLDRYRNLGQKTSISLQKQELSERRNHYVVHRSHCKRKGLKRKVFQLSDMSDNSVKAGAEFASATSKVLEVSNPRGLVCEVDVLKRSKFVMRLGSDPVIVIKGSSGRRVEVQFMEVDGIEPPYNMLVSPAHSCDDLKKAFGDRHVIKSVKNCRLCDEGGNEVVAVRKVSKKSLEIDARADVSFLQCFAIGMFMFLSKA